MYFFVIVPFLLLSTQVPSGHGTWVNRSGNDDKATNQNFLKLDSHLLERCLTKINSAENMGVTIVNKHVSSFIVNSKGSRGLATINLTYVLVAHYTQSSVPNPNSIPIGYLAVFVPVQCTYIKATNTLSAVVGYGLKFGGAFYGKNPENARHHAQILAKEYLRQWDWEEAVPRDMNELPDPPRQPRPELAYPPKPPKANDEPSSDDGFGTLKVTSTVKPVSQESVSQNVPTNPVESQKFSTQTNSPNIVPVACSSPEAAPPGKSQPIAVESKPILNPAVPPTPQPKSTVPAIAGATPTMPLTRKPEPTVQQIPEANRKVPSNPKPNLILQPIPAFKPTVQFSPEPKPTAQPNPKSSLKFQLTNAQAQSILVNTTPVVKKQPTEASSATKESGNVKTKFNEISLPENVSSKGVAWQDNTEDSTGIIPNIFRFAESELLGPDFNIIIQALKIERIKNQRVTSYAIDKKTGRGMVIINITYYFHPESEIDKHSESLAVFLLFRSNYSNTENTLSEIFGLYSKFGGPYLRSDGSKHAKAKVDALDYFEKWDPNVFEVEMMPVPPRNKIPPTLGAWQTADKAEEIFKSLNNQLEQDLNTIKEKMKPRGNMPLGIRKIYATSITICEIAQNGMAIVHVEYCPDSRHLDFTSFVAVYFPLVKIGPDYTDVILDVKTSYDHIGGPFCSPYGLEVGSLFQAKVPAIDFYMGWAKDSFKTMPIAHVLQWPPSPPMLRAETRARLESQPDQSISSSSNSTKTVLDPATRLELKHKSATPISNSAPGNAALGSKSQNDKNLSPTPLASENLRNNSHTDGARSFVRPNKGKTPDSFRNPF